MIVARPNVEFTFSHPAHVIAFGFGSGLSPRAPGTVGTLAAWPIGWIAAGVMPPALFAALIVFLFAVGAWACSVTGRHLGVEDHPAMVVDEMVAFLLVLAILPRDLSWQAAAFVLFRAFDIVKPAPIDWFERRFHGGFGVMFDDLLAAGYSLLMLALLKRVLG